MKLANHVAFRKRKFVTYDLAIAEQHHEYGNEKDLLHSQRQMMQEAR
jgi:hypothetical protein